MSDPVWLAEVLRAAGLRVNEYPGAYDRGHGDFGNIWGVVCHHTGSYGESPRGIAEHPDLGLASQLFLDRNGVYTLCGVGIAWHAGQGSWPGIPTNNANSYTIGIEAANDGGGAPGKPHRGRHDDGSVIWSDAQYDAYVRGVAAILKHLGQPASHAIGHKEWAGAAQGKWDPGAIDMNIFRQDVQRVMGEADLAAEGDDDMQLTDTITDAYGNKVSVGDVLKYIAYHTDLTIDQLGGIDTRKGIPAKFGGWKQLGGKTVVDSLADAHAKLDRLAAALEALTAEGKA